MHVFRHPKYYKELKASLKKEAISSEGSTDPEERAPSDKRQAPADGKPQAASLEKQASSPEEQASSLKP